MTDPESVVKNVDELIRVMKHKNVYKFLHLPVQSASDNVLKTMRRRYQYSEYENLILKLQEEIPGVTIATDFIVGFPGETEEDFQKSIQCMKLLKFPVVNITQYYVRENTIAARLPQLDERIKKERSKIASQCAVEQFNREQYIG